MTLVENLLSVMEPSTFDGLVNLINLNLQHSSEVVKNPSHSTRNRITAICSIKGEQKNSILYQF